MSVYQKTSTQATITNCIQPDNPTNLQPHNRTIPQTRNYTKTQLPLVRDSKVTPQAIALFRLLERLSQRAGYACVKLLETLAGMMEKSVRAVRYALAELIAAGWIKRQQTRKGGVSKLFFWPLVRISGRSRGLFSAPPVAGCVAAYSQVVLQDTPSTPIKKSPIGTKDDNRQQANEALPEPCPVAVSLFKICVSEGEALELAREAQKQQLNHEQIKRVLDAYKGQLANIRNRGAWLRAAIRRSFSPACKHIDNQNERPVRLIVAPPEYRKLINSINEKLKPLEFHEENIKVDQDVNSLKTTGIDRVRAVIAAKKNKELVKRFV